MAKYDFAAEGMNGGKLGIIAENKAIDANSSAMATIANILAAIKKAGGYRDAKGNDTVGFTAYRATFLKTMSDGLGITIEEAKNRPNVKRWFGDARLAYDSNFSVGKVEKMASTDALRNDPKAVKRDKVKVGGRPAKPAREKVTDYLTKMLPELDGNDRRAVLLWFANECRIKATIEAPAEA